MLHIQSLKHSYGGAPVLDLQSLNIAKGQHTLIMGPSGSGKSTLLHCIAGLMTPREGQITVDETNITALPIAARDRFRGQYIGIVFQRFHLVPSLTVLGNVLLARLMADLPQERADIFSVLEHLHLADKVDTLPQQLSQGETQRAAIARAVANHPRLILADEPTSSLDDANAERVLVLLKNEAAQHDATLIVSTHDRRLIPHFVHSIALGARA